MGSVVGVKGAMACECRILFHCCVCICVFLYIHCVESIGLCMWFRPSFLEGWVCVGIVVVLPFCWPVRLLVIVSLSVLCGVGISVFFSVWNSCGAGLECCMHACIPVVCRGTLYFGIGSVLMGSFCFPVVCDGMWCPGICCE